MVMAVVVVGEKYCGESERELTVRKTSLFYPGDGFAAYDHHTGDLVFRVDTYGRGPSHISSHSLAADNLVLMDPSGHAILTVRRKWPSLHQRWEGFLGESVEGQKPLFTVRRSSIFGSGSGSGISVEVHGGGEKNRADYRIQGSFSHRCCRLLMYPTTNTSSPDAAAADDDHSDHHSNHKDDDDDDDVVTVVAEIKRKVDASTNVVLGKDVFCLCLSPGFDAAFAMGIVLVLDQIGHGNGEREDDGIHTTAEPTTAE